MKEVSRPFVINQLIIFMSLVVACICFVVTIGIVYVGDVFELVYYFFGYFVAFNLGVYISGWTLENLIFLLLKHGLNKQLAPSARFWFQLILTIFLMVFSVVFLIVAFVLLK